MCQMYFSGIYYNYCNWIVHFNNNHSVFKVAMLVTDSYEKKTYEKSAYLI